MTWTIFHLHQPGSRELTRADPDCGVAAENGGRKDSGLVRPGPEKCGVAQFPLLNLHTIADRAPQVRLKYLCLEEMRKDNVYQRKKRAAAKYPWVSCKATELNDISKISCRFSHSEDQHLFRGTAMSTVMTVIIMNDGR